MAVARWVALVALALPAGALAEGQPQPDPLSLVIDGVKGAAQAQATPDRPCPELSGGTAGLPEKDFLNAFEDGVAAPLPPVPAGPVPANLPRRVDLRSTTATFNRRYAFVLRDGHVYYRAQPAGQPRESLMASVSWEGPAGTTPAPAPGRRGPAVAHPLGRPRAGRRPLHRKSSQPAINATSAPGRALRARRAGTTGNVATVGRRFPRLRLEDAQVGGMRVK